MKNYDEGLLLESTESKIKENWKDKKVYEEYKKVNKISFSYEEWCEFVDQYGCVFIQQAKDIVNFCKEYKQPIVALFKNINKKKENKKWSQIQKR